MHEYDTALKSVLKRLTGSVLRDLTGFTVTRWHNVELSAVQNRRADLLGETSSGELVHIELQSANQREMAFRMLEYAVAIHRQFHRFPEQVVLYVGQPPLRMKNRIEKPHLEYSCRIVDIRSLDSAALLASDRVEENVIAVLARLGSELRTVRRILRAIGASDPRKRPAAFQELILLAGLRNIAPAIEREAKQMPILNDIMDHPVLGRERKRGIAIGLKRGREEGLEQGLERGLKKGITHERQVVLQLVAKRFGAVPAALKKRIQTLPPLKLEQTALRVLDATRVEDLLK